MPKFEHLGGGPHQHSDKKTYSKGDVIETDMDLEKMFQGKFKKIPDPVYILVPAPVTPTAPAPEPEKPAPEAPAKPSGITKKDKVTLEDARGDEVTADFDVAKGVKVFRRDGLYHAFEGDKAKPINDKGLKKDQVESAVKKYLDE